MADKPASLRCIQAALERIHEHMDRPGYQEARDAIQPDARPTRAEVERAVLEFTGRPLRLPEGM